MILPTQKKWVLFNLDSKFSYKDKTNDDLTTVTSIFKKVNEIWKIQWMQRTS